MQQQMVLLGRMSLGGNIVPVEDLAEPLQVAFDAGAKRLLLPMASVKDIPTILGELFAKFQTGFYADPVDAVFKALGAVTSFRINNLETEKRLENSFSGEPRNSRLKTKESLEVTIPNSFTFRFESTRPAPPLESARLPTRCAASMRRPCLDECR